MKYQPQDIVKSCRKLESGLRLGQEGIHACQLGPFCAPLYWTGDEAGQLAITKDMIVTKRQWLFSLLNDDHSDIPCKQCHMVELKPFVEVDFGKLGHIDLAATTICNLRCSFCGYTKLNSFAPSKYDALSILREFSADDVMWDSAVDFNGGEPTLLPDLKDYIEYFNSRKIRIFLYTNAVKFSQAVYDGLVKGTIRWVCTSLDAGSPSGFRRVKQRDRFNDVVENLTHYAHAGSQGGGQLAVKYIFCDGNSGNDEVTGFAYAMLAIRPQQVWLTFDFEPLQSLSPDSDDFGGYDYSKLVDAYVQLYRLLKKHGLEAGHFTENHLAAVCRQGKILLNRVKAELEENDGRAGETLSLTDFRGRPLEEFRGIPNFSVAPLELWQSGENPQPWDLSGKKVVLAPACVQTRQLLCGGALNGAEIIGLLDRDTVLQGKTIEGVTVFDYDELKKLKADVVLISVHERHQAAIVQTVRKVADGDIIIALQK